MPERDCRWNLRELEERRSMADPYDREKEELTVGTRFVEHRPLIPFLGMMILGIFTDRFFLSPQEIETGISAAAGRGLSC